MDTITNFALDAYSFAEIAQMSKSGELRAKVKYGASKHIVLQDGTEAVVTLMAFKGDIFDHVPLEHTVFAITSHTF